MLPLLADSDSVKTVTRQRCNLKTFVGFGKNKTAGNTYCTTCKDGYSHPRPNGWTLTKKYKPEKNTQLLIVCIFTFPQAKPNYKYRSVHTSIFFVFVFLFLIFIFLTSKNLVK